jgi:Trk K+ transport system NAD-binding subunit
VDARKAAKDYEAANGVYSFDDTGLNGYRVASLRAYRLENKSTAGKSIAQFRLSYPQYRIVNVVRGGEKLGAEPDVVLQVGDIVGLGGRLEDLTSNIGLMGPEVPDARALNIPLDQAEILITDKSVEGKALKEFRNEDFAGQLQVTRMERGGEPMPVGAETTLHRFDVLFVTGLKSAVDKVAARLGKVARPSTATDLLTLSVGMILGLLVGGINVPVGRFSWDLGLRRPASRHLRVLDRVAPAFLRQHAERGAQHSRGPGARDLHLDCGYQRRGHAAGAAHRRHRGEDLPGGLHRQHDSAGAGVGHRLPLYEDQCCRPDGRRGRGAVAFGSGARGRQGN